MGTYDPLRDYLRGMQFREVMLSFADIEKMIGRALPKSAERPQWWANVQAPGHSQREAWREADFDAFPISGSRKVKFVRKR